MFRAVFQVKCIDMELSARLVWSRLNKLPATAGHMSNLAAPNCAQAAEALLAN